MKKVTSKSSSRSVSKASAKQPKKKSMRKWIALFFLVLALLLTLKVVQQAQNFIQQAQTTSSASSATSNLCKTTLRVGSHGACVKALQKKLGITADGAFGPKTKAAVKKFQKENGLEVDGVVGPKTLAKLKLSQAMKEQSEKSCKATLRVGSRGACVKMLQKKLGITADGAFGPKTKAAVKKYQKEKGLEADGVAGPKTLAKLKLMLKPSKPGVMKKVAKVAGKSPSGQAMPTGDLPEWNMIFSDDFTKDVPLGKFPSAVASKWDAYTDGTPDTAGNQGKPSKYYPSKVVSIKDGVLNKYLHTENGTPMAAAIIPKLPGKEDGQGQLYGKYVVRFRSDSLKGFKTAWLLWPDNGDYLKGGEVDFPEGDLDGPILAFLHHSDSAGKEVTNAYDSKTKYTSWHTATIEWLPNKISFMLDGKTIGSSTTGVPKTSMGYIIQTESCLSESGCPSASTKGNLQIDWVVVYERK